MNKIIENLYLGNFTDASSEIENRYVDAIINVSRYENHSLKRQHPIEYFKISIRDSKSKKNRYPLLIATLTLDYCLKCKFKTLIHCTMGISRSAAIVISYIMWKNNWNITKAFNFVKSIRHCVTIRNFKNAIQRNVNMLRKMNNELKFESYARKTLF